MIGSNAEVKDCFRNEFDDDCVDYSSLPACSAVDLSSITDTVVKS